MSYSGGVTRVGVTPGAATDGITLFFSGKTDDLFSIIALWKVTSFV